jgi:ferredoxin-NADP reductase
MAKSLEITHIRNITHDVKEFTLSKPDGYEFHPGQATEVAIDKDGWRDEKRPFTFTSLPDEDTLQFTIKSYRDHDGVTKQLENLSEGDKLLVDDPWGAITYKGKGVFIAGGAGVTPFLSIFKDLYRQGKIDGNTLLFSNKKGKDVIHESFFQDILGENFISTLTRENIEGHGHGRINMDFIQKHIEDYSQHFYVCGPDAMVKELSEVLESLGANADSIVFEK